MAWFQHISKRRLVITFEGVWGVPVCVEAPQATEARWTSPVCREVAKVVAFAHTDSFTCVGTEHRFSTYAHPPSYVCVQAPDPDDGIFEKQFSPAFE